MVSSRCPPVGVAFHGSSVPHDATDVAGQLRDGEQLVNVLPQPSRRSRYLDEAAAERARRKQTAARDSVENIEVVVGQHAPARRGQLGAANLAPRLLG